MRATLFILLVAALGASPALAGEGRIPIFNPITSGCINDADTGNIALGPNFCAP